MTSRTQWFDYGDHPAVQRPKEAHLQPVPGMKNCGVLTTPANPEGLLVREGDWIIENDDGSIWVYGPEYFRDSQTKLERDARAFTNHSQEENGIVGP